MLPADRATADETEQPLGLARGEDVVGQRPHLRRRDDPEHPDPHVDDRQHPRRLVPVREEPEQHRVRREEDQAAADEGAHRDALPDANVDGHPHADQQGHRDVDIRQLARAEPEEEEGVARGLARDEAPDHQEQVPEESTPRSSSAGRIPSSRVARRGTGAQKPRGWRMKRAVYPIPGGRRTPGRRCRARGLEMGPARSRPERSFPRLCRCRSARPAGSSPGRTAV